MKNVFILLVFFQMSTSVEAQIIPYYGGKLDCDTAYTTLELGWCSKYLLDSATTEMDGLVVHFAQRIDSELEETFNELSTNVDTSLFRILREDTARLIAMRREFRASQEAFLTYSSHCREVVGEMVGMGRERAIKENYVELDLVIARIEVLKQWMGFY